MEALADVARDLRFRLADLDMEPEDIRSSGLGYANLLYMATVVVELAKARESDLTLFLVEEPEAHLHAQLQMLVLDFLLAQAKKSSAQPTVAGQPEGRIQVIVTTHSPNLTAWVSPEHLVVVRSARDAGATPPVMKTVSIPVTGLGLDATMLHKVSRYLDVTRSALLFGTRALLVEGIAEALLMPVLARSCVLNNDPHALQRFRGAVVVAIDGVDFAPYVHILLRPCEGSTIADRVVVVTDADPDSPGNRKVDLDALAASWQVANRLHVLTNTVTLEHELSQRATERCCATSSSRCTRNRPHAGPRKSKARAPLIARRPSLICSNPPAHGRATSPSSAPSVSRPERRFRFRTISDKRSSQWQHERADPTAAHVRRTSRRSFCAGVSRRRQDAHHRIPRPDHSARASPA